MGVIMNVIFLDIDGVLNNFIWEYNEEGILKCSIYHVQNRRVNNFQAICWLNELYRLYDFSIVITSTWKKDVSSIEEMQYILRNSGLREIPVMGFTQTIYDNVTKKILPRGLEIRKYLRKHPEITSFVIIDDDSDMEDLSVYLVKCDTYVGYGLREWEKTCKLLELQGVKKREKELSYVKKYKK